MAEAVRYWDPVPYAGFRRLLSGLDPAARPASVVVRPAGDGRVGVLPGSFNPLTAAHALLAQAPLDRGLVDGVYFLLAVRTVDKEAPEGLTLPDRVWILDEYCRGRPGLGIVLTNRGLYVEEAEALRAGPVPPEKELWFLVGFDKIVQIFDPRYYADREAALRRLFTLSRFYVAPRSGRTGADLAEFLARPENRSFAPYVQYLPLPPEYHDPHLSASAVRQACAAGSVPPGAVPVEVRRFIEATGAFRPPRPTPDGDVVDLYGLRVGLLELIAAGDPPYPPAGTVFRVWEGLTAADPSGRRARELLRAGDLAGLFGLFGVELPPDGQEQSQGGPGEGPPV